VTTGRAIFNPPPHVGLSVAVSGHRDSHPAIEANAGRIAATLARVFDVMDAAVADGQPLGGVARTRLHCLLADGIDQMAASAAAARDWSLVAPLPFGQALNVAVNAQPATAADAQALLKGRLPADEATHKRAEAIQALAGAAHLFELAEHDEIIADLLLRKFEAPDLASVLELRCSERVAVAARVLIEQSDILVGVWDGAAEFRVGGTGHTIATALEMGAPVVWIDANQPDTWRVLRAPEALGSPATEAREDQVAMLSTLVREALYPPDEMAPEARGRDGGHTAGEVWRPRSTMLWHAFRRIEALFDQAGSPFRSIRMRYEPPDEIGQGACAGVMACARALPGGDPRFADVIEAGVLRPFAWFDGVSSYLSDSYRAGTTLNFLLGALAVVIGVAYGPLGAGPKWIFSLAEFLALATILLITAIGQKRRWHRRWFETRRVAEYLRHAPTMLLLGVARPPGRWPRGMHTSWPEYYARHQLRCVGLPRVAVRSPYLRAALVCLLDQHVVPQRDYHLDKAGRLTSVHRRLDRVSQSLFQLAVVSVSTYLALTAATAAGLFPHALLTHSSKAFSFLGVALPTFGGAVAGIRYFGDFERFAAISDVTAEKLEAVGARIRLLLTVPDARLDYARAAELARLTDEIVTSEIESWQAVFGGKHITLPV
jgi:hypothetical protein